MQYIISYGGNIELKNNFGQTPLHKAVVEYWRHRSSKGIKYLLTKGANRNAVDNENEKPVDYLPVLKPDKEGFY